MSENPEFSRPLSVGALGSHSIEANEDERVALARRFDLIAIESLSAEANVAREDDAVIATGSMSAALVQECVVTDQPVPDQIEESFTLRFLPEDSAPTAEETELEEDDCETLYYDGDSFDFGEAIAQTMALALNPFPRSIEAEAAAKEAGILQEDDIKPDSPFSALESLKKQQDE